MNDPKDKGTPETENVAKVIVTVSDDASADMAAVTRRLEDAGLAVDEVLDFLGQIVGRCSPRDVEPLLKVEGVADVSKSQAVQLAPPGSPIQ